MRALPGYENLNRYYLWSWLLLAAHLSLLTIDTQHTGIPGSLWVLAATASYAFFYLIPALLMGYLARAIAGRRLEPTPATRTILAATLVLPPSLVQTLLLADRQIYAMYGFHINGFVIDLVLTPGGIASLGANLQTQLTATLLIASMIAVQAGLCYWLCYRRPALGAARTHLRWRWLMLLLIVLSVSERLAFAYSAATHYQPILFASEAYPFYLPLTMRKVAGKLGIADTTPREESLKLQDNTLNYPLTPIIAEPPEKPLNIVWLVAESLRYDMLDPVTMPRLWDLSEQSLRLEKHFSGGNMTQMGVFSMFYGLYANYWTPMLSAKRSPVLMDVLQQQNYQFGLYTSQRFTYPAFDKTVFARMRPVDLHERQGGASAWQRDRQNVDDILNFIDHRDTSRPFMSYMFFESTHADYNFPEETVIARPYLENLNYLTADFKADIGLIKNRYINAAHHVDQQIGRIVAHLRERKLLDNTVIIVLGDHGEEFMERGRWGHSAEFNRFQTSTPAVIHVPGEQARVISGITSHIDIPATLLPLLGVRNPASDFSLGFNLLDSNYHRDFAVAGDWNRIAYIGNDFKVSFPMTAAGAVRKEATDGEDWPLANTNVARQAIQPAMVEIMSNLNRFGSRKSTSTQLKQPG